MSSKISLAVIILYLISIGNGFSQDQGTIKKIDSCYQKIQLLESRIDSLEKENKFLNSENSTLVISEAEKLIQNKVYEMHKAWEELSTVGNSIELLKFFRKKYIINRVTINDDNTAEVENYNHKTFKEYIKKVIADNGVKHVFKDVNFLSTEVKDDTYFTTTYRCILNSYKDDTLVRESSLLVTLTGKKDKDNWGIASYSWINFRYNK